jgi:hypothetical protein
LGWRRASASLAALRSLRHMFRYATYIFHQSMLVSSSCME